MTNGMSGGTSGEQRRAFLKAWLVFAVLSFSVDTVNVFTTLHDRAVMGHPVAAWEPVVWEYSSGIAGLVWIPLAALALRLATPGRDAPLKLLLHLPAALLFSVMHVGGMWLIRMLVYAGVGGSYWPHLGEFLYELRKDVLTYGIGALLFWLFARLGERAAAKAADAPAVFDIRDGGRLVRAPVGEILAVSSAGNYVEFALADGRRPLMRATLSKVETDLNPHGFVRTHRSWLVNPARVRVLDAEGSGDFTLELEGGTKVPLSRRYPQALSRLRGG